MIKRLAMQRAGFDLASMHIKDVYHSLHADESRFLFDNLGYPSHLMAQTSNWLENLFLADEAIDLGEINVCLQYLRDANTALRDVLQVSEKYCYGKWAEWYRGERILNISFSLEKTQEMLQSVKEIQTKQ
jgi:hypothetical protein